MDGNFCRATNLNIMSTKFAFNSPKTPNLWKFSRCSISYIKTFLQKSDRYDYVPSVICISLYWPMLANIQHLSYILVKKGYTNVWFYSDGTECLRSHTATGVPLLSEVAKSPDADTQCRTAFGLESFLCRVSVAIQIKIGRGRFQLSNLCPIPNVLLYNEDMFQSNQN